MHSERFRPSFIWMLWGMDILLVLLYSGLPIAILGKGGGPQDLIGIGFSASMAIPIMAFFTWAFGWYGVDGDATRLRFGYSGWRVTLRSGEIRSIEPVDINWWKWGGMGWRWHPKNGIGYITGSGTGLRIQTIHGRTYVFNCRDPASLMAALGVGQSPG